MEITHQLVPVEDYQHSELLYILDVIIEINGITRDKRASPIYLFSDRKSKRELDNLYSKFIFKTEGFGKGNKTFIRGKDPLEPLKKIMLLYNNIKFDKFILEREEIFVPKYTKFISEVKITVRYLVIKESIISFLEGIFFEAVSSFPSGSKVSVVFPNSISASYSFFEFFKKRGRRLVKWRLTPTIRRPSANLSKVPPWPVLSFSPVFSSIIFLNLLRKAAEVILVGLFKRKRPSIERVKSL